LKYAKGMDEECFNTSKFLRKSSIKGLIFLKVFLVALSLDDKRATTWAPTFIPKGEKWPELPAPLSVFTIELSVAIAPWSAPTTLRSIKENFLTT
jgi:hypothetical protein